MAKMTAEKLLRQAEKYKATADFEKACQKYEEVLQQFPGNKRARQGLVQIKNYISKNDKGLSSKLIDRLLNLYQQGDMSVCYKQIKICLESYPKNHFLLNLLGAVCDNLNYHEEAIHFFKLAIQVNPGFPDAYNHLGSIYMALEDFDAAEAAFHKAILIKPRYTDALNNLAELFLQKNKTLDALEVAQKAIKSAPESVNVLLTLSKAFEQNGEIKKAIKSMQKIVAFLPDSADIFFRLGNLYRKDKSFDEAFKAYNNALQYRPEFKLALLNLGSLSDERKELDQALKYYSRLIQIDPEFSEAYNNVGNVYLSQGERIKALAAFQRAIALKPDFPEAFLNLGNLYKEEARLQESIEAYKQAIFLSPNYAKAFSNLGNVFQEEGQLEEAIKNYEEALNIEPQLESVRALKLHLQAQICDWSKIEMDRKFINKIGLEEQFVPPFTMLSLDDSPERQLIRSRITAESKYPQQSLPISVDPTFNKRKKLRIGYFSADFHNHATMYLMAKVFEEHDKEKFEVFAYSFGPETQDQMRGRLIKAVDVFKEVNKLSDLEVAELARKDSIDIAVDLKGYTKLERLGIFAYRAAPIQISYLGYPGTTGSTFIDYILADETVIPNSDQYAYSEKIIYLPNSYQVNDNTRKISDKKYLKRDMGLPEESFVFCCFNSNYKISPAEFDIWVRLLLGVDGSVLWLLKSNSLAEKNLRKEAEKRGVLSERLVFADRLDHADHLARHRLADIFLDTFNVNAHTTASDALWAGLPIITKPGKGFAARVAASLLKAMNLSEMIANSEKEYEMMALDLALNKPKLKELKRRLEINKKNSPLYDSNKFTRHLENAYQTAYENYFKD